MYYVVNKYGGDGIVVHDTKDGTDEYISIKDAFSIMKSGVKILGVSFEKVNHVWETIIDIPQLITKVTYIYKGTTLFTESYPSEEYKMKEKDILFTRAKNIVGITFDKQNLIIK